MVNGASKGKGKRKGRKQRMDFVKNLSEDQKVAFKTELHALKSDAGWDALSGEDKRTAKLKIFTKYQPAK